MYRLTASLKYPKKKGGENEATIAGHEGKFRDKKTKGAKATCDDMALSFFSDARLVPQS